MSPRPGAVVTFLMPFSAASQWRRNQCHGKYIFLSLTRFAYTYTLVLEQKCRAVPFCWSLNPTPMPSSQEAIRFQELTLIRAQGRRLTLFFATCTTLPAQSIADPQSKCHNHVFPRLITRLHPKGQEGERAVGLPNSIPGCCCSKKKDQSKIRAHQVT